MWFVARSFEGAGFNCKPRQMSKKTRSENCCAKHTKEALLMRQDPRVTDWMIAILYLSAILFWFFKDQYYKKAFRGILIGWACSFAFGCLLALIFRHLDSHHAIGMSTGGYYLASAVIAGPDGYSSFWLSVFGAMVVPMMGVLFFTACILIRDKGWVD